MTYNFVSKTKLIAHEKMCGGNIRQERYNEFKNEVCAMYIDLTLIFYSVAIKVIHL